MVSSTDPHKHVQVTEIYQVQKHNIGRSSSVSRLKSSLFLVQNFEPVQIQIDYPSPSIQSNFLQLF